MRRPNYNDKGSESEQFRKLFIGGLDYRTTDDALKNFFSQWGEIVDVVVMKHPTTGKSRGFGFVTYSDMEMVDKAMANRPHKIDGREVDSKRAVPRDESGRPDANQNMRKMFVGGLKDQPEEELKEYFSKFGKVVNVNIVTDQDGKRKGFCFIEFDDYDPVDKCVLYKNHMVAGKSLTVKKAIPKDSMGKGGSGGGGGGGRGGGRDQGRGGRGGGGKWGGGQNTDVWGGGNQWGSGGGGGYGGGGGSYGGGGWDSGPQGGGGSAWGGGNNSWNDRQGGGGGGGYGGGGWGGGSGNMGGGYGGQPGGGGGYGGGGGGGPVRNNYLSQNRSAPYGKDDDVAGGGGGGGGGGYGGGGGGSWGGSGGGRY